MPIITITRPYEWFNQERITKIYIDGEKIGDVGIDQTVQFEVSLGKHKVELKQRWSGGSLPFLVDLNGNEKKNIKMKSFQYNWLVFPFLFVFANSLYLSVVNHESFIIKLLGSLIVSGFIYLVIYILFLRTRFIKMEEVVVVNSQ